MKPGDGARVTTFVAVAPEDAFDVFTRETDLWWRRGPRFRFAAGNARGTLRFDEPGPHGRLVEAFDDGGEFVVGRVLVWERAACLSFEWRGHDFGPGEVTEVSVRFEAMNGGTRVTLEHVGWGAIRADHPARHGLDTGAFAAMIGTWWGDLATSLRTYITDKPSSE